MHTVIRLIRLALLLQLLINTLVITAVGLPTPRASLTGVVVMILCTVPSLTIVALTVVAERRGWVSRRVVIGLLCAVIAAFALESVGASLGELSLPPGAPLMPRQAPALFLFIPAVLGTWVSGRRGAFWWAAAASIALAASGAAVWIATGFSAEVDVLPILAQAAIMTILCTFVGTLTDRQRAEHAQLQAAHQLLTNQSQVREQLAASRERLRLARDLHDTLAHTLAGLLVQLRAVQSLTGPGQEQIAAELQIAERAARTGLVETRAAIANLRGSQVNDLGLAGALQHALDGVAERTGARTSFTQTGAEPLLPAETAATLFLIAQEALRNVERHAHASHISLTLDAPPDGTLVLTVRDDGVGFDAAAVTATRFGVRGLHERAALIGAQLQIHSAQPGGTSVELRTNGGGGGE